MHFDLQTLIKTFGYPLVWGIVFAESGLLVGFLLPGDSLLFVAGFMCSLTKTGLDIRVMAFGCFVFAVVGDSVGYYTGKRFGRKLFDKEDSRFFKKKHLVAAEDFFEVVSYVLKMRRNPIDSNGRPIYKEDDIFSLMARSMRSKPMRNWFSNNSPTARTRRFPR